MTINSKKLIFMHLNKKNYKPKFYIILNYKPKYYFI